MLNDIKMIANKRDVPYQSLMKSFLAVDAARWRAAEGVLAVRRRRTIFNRTEACPREIRLTKAIGEVKKAVLKRSRDIPIRQAPLPTGDAAGGCTIHDRPCGRDVAGPVLFTSLRIGTGCVPSARQSAAAARVP